MKKCELLSPAGGAQSLAAAVKCGADSVYFGGTMFNARSYADNFDSVQLKEAVDYCHLRKVRTLVTVNTLVNDKEFAELEQYLVFLNDIGVDGIIVQDLGVARLAQRAVPLLPLHASTQMTVCDTDGALLLQDYGFKRVVLARELSCDEIAKIRAAVEIELEMFVHGAICVCYSGQCLMSSFIGGRSGNRGKCAQPCRLCYSADRASGTLLSPKDMSLIGHLKEIKNIGVNSLKIEGRMKGADYVGAVVSIYRKYLDSELCVTPEDYDILNGIFYRGGLTDGYFTGNLSEMMVHNKPDNPYQRQKPYTPPEHERKRTADFDCAIQESRPARLTARTDDISVTVIGNAVAEHAVNRALTSERVTEQLSKLGGTVFTAGAVNTEIDSGVTLPISELNALRRNAVSALEQAVADSFRRKHCGVNDDFPSFKSVKDGFSLSVMVSTKQQRDEFSDVEQLYVPLEIYNGSGIAVLPRISYDGLYDEVRAAGCKRLLVRNIGQLKMFDGFELYADFTLNVFNSRAVKMLFERGVCGVTLSAELMLSQIRDIKSELPLESVIYGYMPLMLTKNCLIKPSSGCKNGRGMQLCDRTGAVFKVKCLKDCKNEIYNCLPIVMSDKMPEVKVSGLRRGRLMFTDEAPSQCREIYRAYSDGLSLDIPFTRGKFYNKV